MDVSTLKLDKLSFTVLINEEDRDVIYNIILDAARDRDLNLRPIPPTCNYLKQYRLGVYLMINSDTGYECTIHVGPYYEENAFLRFEWSPANAGDIGYESVSDFINYLADHCHGITRHSFNITRLDFAVDITGVRPDDLIIDIAGMRRSAGDYDVNGRTETLEIGHKKGKRRYIIYDKTVEAATRRVVMPQVTRFEARLRDNFSTSDLQSISNPLLPVRVEEWIHITDAVISDRRRIMFLDSCRYRGKMAALRFYSSNGRQQMREWLNRVARAAWWEPEGLWREGWPPIRFKLMVLFGYRVRCRV